MEYYIYLDAFFLLNFIMNALLLVSVLCLLGSRIETGRIGLGAALGSIWNIILLFIPITVFGSRFFAAFIMVTVACGKKSLKDHGKEAIALYILAFSFEGAICFCHSWWSVLIPTSICLLLGKERKQRRNWMTVILTFKGKTKALRGFYDTGNRLSEPITGRMVHIASYDSVKEILPENYRQTVEYYFETGMLESTKVTKLQMYEFTFLSYHSIGKETGQLLGIRMDSAVFLGNVGKKTEEKAVIALTNQEMLRKDHCQMIINGRLEL